MQQFDLKKNTFKSYPSCTNTLSSLKASSSTCKSTGLLAVCRLRLARNSVKFLRFTSAFLRRSTSSVRGASSSPGSDTWRWWLPERTMKTGFDVLTSGASCAFDASLLLARTRQTALLIKPRANTERGGNPLHVCKCRPKQGHSGHSSHPKAATVVRVSTPLGVKWVFVVRW